MSFVFYCSILAIVGMKTWGIKEIMQSENTVFEIYTNKFQNI